MQRRIDARRGARGAAPDRARARRRERRCVAARLRRGARTHRGAASVRTASRAAHPSPEHGLRLDMDASMNTLVRPAGSPLNDKVDSAVSWRAAAYLRRVLVFVLTVAQTVAGTNSIIAVLPYHGGTGLEQAIVVVFAVRGAGSAGGGGGAGRGGGRRRRGGE